MGYRDPSVVPARILRLTDGPSLRGFGLRRTLQALITWLSVGSEAMTRSAASSRWRVGPDLEDVAVGQDGHRGLQSPRLASADANLVINLMPVLVTAITSGESEVMVPRYGVRDQIEPVFQFTGPTRS